MALALLTGWVAATVAVFAHAAPVHLAWQAALTASTNPDPLADPPPDVAIVDLQIAIMLATALPVALTILLLGLVAVLLRRGRGWALAPSWIATAVGAFGLLPAIVATLAGLAGGVFNGFILFG
ncbi:hypothetical protein ABC270_07795 [Curtobacterium sp. 1P10AnD]|uniref:hypothetical protein n=1 Tax=Curtobacterium sp. 1P10AnD TaxID=3132283 RepID=UPI00399F1C8E